MTASAIAMMVISMLIVWGGLIAAVVFLRLRPEVGEAELPDPDNDVADLERQELVHPSRDTSSHP